MGHHKYNMQHLPEVLMQKLQKILLQYNQKTTMRDTMILYNYIDNRDYRVRVLEVLVISELSNAHCLYITKRRVPIKKKIYFLQLEFMCHKPSILGADTATTEDMATKGGEVVMADNDFFFDGKIPEGECVGGLSSIIGKE
ncbi:hypothetical protein IEQ34_011715 [Dendrobium chrysotoxum]|uniref:Uncharacterized protein n=1 Tax=Dendrobium chrysotoxum TaxID=161865 RepID=A0AAV7GSC2_DENCH|nr:hypothetical protein IEQ34_011715 [Dendrobium chrysotoxum]